MRRCLDDCLYYPHCTAAEFNQSDGVCKHHVESHRVDPTQISTNPATDLFILSRCV